MLVVGAVAPGGRAPLNSAFVCRGGRVAAAPKLALPNYDEFYEKRWFASRRGVEAAVEAAGSRFPLRDGLMCRLGDTAFGIELALATDRPWAAHASGGSRGTPRSMCS